MLAVLAAETMRKQVNEATSALEEATRKAASERRELLKTIDDVKAAGEAKLAALKDAQAMAELKRKEEDGKTHLEAARKAQSDASDDAAKQSARLSEKLKAASVELKKLRAQLTEAGSDTTAALRSPRRS